MAAPYRLNVFGPPQLLDGRGTPIPFRTKKHLALLTYLHFEGRQHPLSRDSLTDLLWPQALPARGRHSLSQALLAIRQRLGADALARTDRRVQLLADLSSELDQVQRAQGAPYRLAQPLRGMEDCAGPEFAHWVDAARAGLVMKAREALRTALKVARARGNLSENHLIASVLYDLDPLCADAVYALAERALLDGDTVLAVRLLKDHVRRAQSELGSNPNPEVAQLLGRLERGERPGFALREGPLTQTLGRRELFVGREGELAQLEAIWDRAQRSGYQTGLITGAPGIGKSSLLRRFATSLAARTWPVAVVPCQEIGQGIPYAAVAELIMALGKDPQAGGTDPTWLAEASRVCPALRAVYPGVPQPPEAPTDSIRLRVAEALLRMMEVVSNGGPILLAFDDIQFMDPASREVLFLVTRRLEKMPTLILAGARTGEPAGPEHGGLSWVENIRLSPLDRAHTVELIGDLAAESGPVDRRILETIVRLAQGNPYHIELLWADWERHQANSLVEAESSGRVVSWSPPEDLRSAFSREYAGLSTDAQHLLQVIAVAGRAMTGRDLGVLLGLDGRVIDRASLEMLDAGLTRVEGGRLTFKNELHRAFVYYAMEEERRAYFHSRLAEMLSRAPEGEDFQRFLEASHHFISARMPTEACDTALKGAELALLRGAPKEAERALVVLQRSCPQDAESRVHLVLADTLVAEGRFRDAIDVLGKWRPASPSPADTALAAQLRAEALHRGRLVDDQTILESATLGVSLARGANADLILIRALQIRAEVAAESGELSDAEDAGAHVQRAAEDSASPECKALAGQTRGYCMLVAGRLDAAAGAFRAAIPLLQELGLLVELRRVMNGLGICYTGLVRLAEAVRSFALAMALARKLGDQVAMCDVWNNVGVTYHEAGHFDAAARCYQEAISLLPLTSRTAPPLYANAARLAMECGDLPEADSRSRLALSISRESQSWRLIVGALTVQADIHLARSEPEWAWPLVEEAMDLTRDRSNLLADAGQFARLRKHFLWTTKGGRSAEAFNSPAPHDQLELKLAELLELRAFEEWASPGESTAVPGEPAAQQLIRRGLFGVLARLLAVGVQFEFLQSRRADESSAQLVSRIFEPLRRVRLPQFDDLLQASAVL